MTLRFIGDVDDVTAQEVASVLGRVRRGAGSLAAILSSREQTIYGTGKITEIVIYESRELRQAAEYIALARIPISYRNK